MRLKSWLAEGGSLDDWNKAYELVDGAYGDAFTG